MDKSTQTAQPFKAGLAASWKIQLVIWVVLVALSVAAALYSNSYFASYSGEDTSSNYLQLVTVAVVLGRVASLFCVPGLVGAIAGVVAAARFDQTIPRTLRLVFLFIGCFVGLILVLMVPFCFIPELFGLAVVVVALAYVAPVLFVVAGLMLGVACTMKSLSAHTN